jgi:hypothetical protein
LVNAASGIWSCGIPSAQFLSFGIMQLVLRRADAPVFPVPGSTKTTASSTATGTPYSSPDGPSERPRQFFRNDRAFQLEKCSDNGGRGNQGGSEIWWCLKPKM